MQSLNLPRPPPYLLMAPDSWPWGEGHEEEQYPASGASTTRPRDARVPADPAVPSFVNARTLGVGMSGGGEGCGLGMGIARGGEARAPYARSNVAGQSMTDGTSAQEIVLSATAGRNVRQSGRWDYAHADDWSRGQRGVDFLYTKGEEGEAPSFTFMPSLGCWAQPDSDNVRVEVLVWYPGHAEHSADVHIEVHHTSGNSVCIVDQQSATTEWKSLGTFEMSAKDRARAKVLFKGPEGEGNKLVCVDSIMLRHV